MNRAQRKKNCVRNWIIAKKEPVQGPKIPDHVIRYIVTHLNKESERVMIGPRQGSYTYATREKAQEHLDAMLTNNNLDMLKRLYGFPLEVRPCRCYPVHFDPMPHCVEID